MNPQAGNRTAVLSMTTLPSCQVRGTWNLTGFLISPLCLKLPTHVICEKEVTCSTNQIVIFSDGTLTEKSGRDSRGLRGILAISPFKNYCWWSYFRFLPGMMDICISECQTDHAQGEEIAWSTVFLPRDCEYLQMTLASVCLLAEGILFFCASLSSPSPRWFFHYYWILWFSCLWKMSLCRKWAVRAW